MIMIHNELQYKEVLGKIFVKYQSKILNYVKVFTKRGEILGLISKYDKTGLTYIVMGIFAQITLQSTKRGRKLGYLQHYTEILSRSISRSLGGKPPQ